VFEGRRSLWFLNLGLRKEHLHYSLSGFFNLPSHVRPRINERKWTLGNVKGPCTLGQALRVCTGRTAHRGSRGIALLFLGHGTSKGWVVSVTPRPLFTPGKDQVPIVQEGGWAPGPVWTGAENLAPNGIRSPDRLARRQSPYRLSYPAHRWTLGTCNKIGCCASSEFTSLTRFVGLIVRSMKIILLKMWRHLSCYIGIVIWGEISASIFRVVNWDFTYLILNTVYRKIICST
jgi:hypothetical protein